VEIPRHAERIGAALIVLGRTECDETRSSGPSIREGILRRSVIPTLHIPPGAGWFSRVLIALDGSERGLSVLHHGTELAAGLSLPLALVAVEPKELALVGGELDAPLGRIQRLAGRLAQLGVSAPLLGLQGDPVEQVLASATPQDLLVVGYRRGVDDSAPDRVGRHLIRQAPCAVLAVPI
jgi:nucleotide-binding universal stress UspA family protein